MYRLLVILTFALAFQGCIFRKRGSSQVIVQAANREYYPSAKPLVRWWWFAKDIHKSDIAHQLNWVRDNHFGGVEIAWVYPLHRYQSLYANKHKRFYPVDTSAQKWLSAEWLEMVAYAKHYADSIGLLCDFSFGSAWPSAGMEIDPQHSAMVYGDTAFRQTVNFAWNWPETPLVINHLDSQAFRLFANPITRALGPLLKDGKSALFTDSWEVKMNSSYKIWTHGFEDRFKTRFGYDIIPYIEQQLDSFPDVRYDYMLLLHDYITEGFYRPYAAECRALNAPSRLQCLASPTDVMSSYALVDIPESEAMLNDPNYSRIVSSAACLSSKPLVSCEAFTCMYGFPSSYLRREQSADLKLVADALFAQGVNQLVYHGMPYNPAGSDSIEFFATTYFGPGGNLEPELPALNEYVEKVSNWLRTGRVFSDVAVYIPYEDAVMKGAYPPERQRVWVWGEYEMRYIQPPAETKGYHPIYINRHFLELSRFEDGKLKVGDAEFQALYVDVQFLDVRALRRILELARKGLTVCWKNSPRQPGLNKDPEYGNLLAAMADLPNVQKNLESLTGLKPLISGKEVPAYWARIDQQDTLYLFVAQRMARDLSYPVYMGMSYMAGPDTLQLEINHKGRNIPLQLVLEPYQSRLLKISPDGEVDDLDIYYLPKEPVVLPRARQKSYF